MKVFLLLHVHTMGDRSEDTKIIGISSSEERVGGAIARLSSLLGFLKKDGEFHIDAYEMDEDHWTSGFVSCI